MGMKERIAATSPHVKWFSATVLTNLLITGFFTGVKQFGGEERPCFANDFTAYISGHSAWSMCLLGSLYLSYEMYSKEDRDDKPQSLYANTPIRYSMYAAGTLIATTTQWGRVFAGKHWLGNLWGGDATALLLAAAVGDLMQVGSRYLATSKTQTDETRRPLLDEEDAGAAASSNHAGSGDEADLEAQEAPQKTVPIESRGVLDVLAQTMLCWNVLFSNPETPAFVVSASLLVISFAARYANYKHAGDEKALKKTLLDRTPAILWRDFDSETFAAEAIAKTIGSISIIGLLGANALNLITGSNYPFVMSAKGTVADQPQTTADELDLYNCDAVDAKAFARRAVEKGTWGTAVMGPYLAFVVANHLYHGSKLSKKAILTEVVGGLALAATTTYFAK